MSRSTRIAHTRDEKREAMRQAANATRTSADAMAILYDGCDDVLHPTMPFDPQPFRDWIDFYEWVILPLVVFEDDEARIQEAMRLYRQANPHFIAMCFYMAARSDPSLAQSGELMKRTKS